MKPANQKDPSEIVQSFCEEGSNVLKAEVLPDVRRALEAEGYTVLKLTENHFFTRNNRWYEDAK